MSIPGPSRRSLGFLALLLGIIGAEAHAGIVLVQATSTRGTSVTSLVRAFPSANTAGNLIIAFVRASTATQTVTVRDSAGNAYAEAVGQTQTSDGHQIHVFYASGIRGVANTVTATFSGTNNHPWLALYEYSGVRATSPLDQTARAQGNGATPSSGATATTASPSELVFAATGLPASYTGTVAAGAGYALQQQDTGTSRAANEATIASATGSWAGTFGLSSATNWSAVVATFLPASVTTTTTVSSTTTTTATAAPSTTTSSTTTTTTTRPASDTISLVQSNAVEGSGVASVSSAFPSSNTAGNLIVAFVRMSTTSQAVRITDTAGNAYFGAVSQAQTSDGHQIRIFYASSIAAGANTVTAAFSGTNNHSWLAIYEYSGVNALDQSAHAQGSGTVASSGSTGVIAAPNELLFAGLGLASSSNAVVTAGSGYALERQDGVPNGSRAATEDAVSTSTGSFAGAFNLGTATNWSCALATFRNAPVSPPGVSHYEYVFPDGQMYVYDIDNGFREVKQVSLPQAMPIRGVAANPATHILYISYGGDGGPNGNGSMLAYDLLTDAVMWSRSYTTGIDSMALTPDGRTIYMPTGETSPGNTWTVLDSSNGAVTATIAAGAGPHNTVVGLDGARVYMGPRNYNFLIVGSTATNTVTRSLGPLYAGVRPFTINGRQSLAFTTATQFLGFQVSDINTGRVLYTMPIAGFGSNPSFLPSSWSHGISLSPDEREAWVMDGPNSYVHVFDVTGLPGSAPRQVADLPLSRPVTGSKSPCPYDCLREGWIQHSRDGRYVFVGDAGDVFDTATRRAVVNLDPLYNSRIHVEIDWRDGLPIDTTTRQGLGYVTQ